ncbi:MAG: aminotransferase class I/II-fold pyridoxal phosphate-dependent enzyme [Coprococcus sp.]
MEFNFASRLDSFEEGIFATLNDKKNELVKAGRKVYNMSVGTPDFKPAQHIMDAVSEAASKPENYKYALADLPELLDAVSNHYAERYGVKGIRHEEIMSIYGSQEGMAHIAMAICDPGDVVLVPNPGYPVFTAGPFLCGAKVETYDLHPENNFLIEFDKIPEEQARRAKMMIVSYPLNPVCVTAPDSFYEELITFRRNATISFSRQCLFGYYLWRKVRRHSFLLGEPGTWALNFVHCDPIIIQAPRMSFVVGNQAVIDKFKNVRSQIDYGIFLPVQYGAIAALTGPQDAVKAQCEEYDRRNHALSEGLTSIGWKVPLSQGTMFSWAHIPEGFANSNEFVMELMEKTGLIVTPGSSFGSLGEGFVRFALVLDVPTIQEAVRSVKESGILNSRM